MEADKKTLAMKAWPPQIRDNVHGLDKCKVPLPACAPESG
jgi:hypothetical protein